MIKKYKKHPNNNGNIYKIISFLLVNLSTKKPDKNKVNIEAIE